VVASSVSTADTPGSSAWPPDADGVAGEVDSIAQFELVEDLGALAVDRLGADGGESGDLLGGVAFGDELDGE